MHRVKPRQNKGECYICGTDPYTIKVGLYATMPPIVDGEHKIDIVPLCEKCTKKITEVAIEEGYTRTGVYYFVYECIVRGKRYLDRKYKEVKEK